MGDLEDQARPDSVLVRPHGILVRPYSILFIIMVFFVRPDSI
jgi:hypothetical protein